jgi:hypothetical protein
MAKSSRGLTRPTFGYSSDTFDYDNALKVEQKKWDKQYDCTEAAEYYFNGNNKKCYLLFLQHCTKPLKTKLEGMDGWAIIKVSQDGIELIKMIRDICHRCDDSNQGMIELVNTAKAGCMSW